MTLAVTGTLGGVIITQLANSVSTRATRRKERNDRIDDAVGDLIARGQAWVYAVDACQKCAFDAVRFNKDQEEIVATLTSGRADVHSAQLAYARAAARVRLTCPPSINEAAQDYIGALLAFDEEMNDKVGIVLETRNVDAVQHAVPEGVVAPQDQLVKATRNATGR